jgi:hypothetical protein
MVLSNFGSEPIELTPGVLPGPGFNLVSGDRFDPLLPFHLAPYGSIWIATDPA